SMVGSDIETGASRMAFNIPELADGLGFATVAMGLFGFAEIIRNLDVGGESDRELVQQKVTGLMPTKKDMIDSTPAILRGTVPGPQVMQKQPELVWGMIASMWVGNLMLLIINLPLVGIWVRLLRVPYRLMFPSIVIFCSIGIYSVNNAPVDVILAGAFGLVGYWLIKHDFEPAPLLLGMVLGPLMEENLRRALLISRGDWSVFLTRPLSAVLLAIAA